MRKLAALVLMVSVSLLLACSEHHDKVGESIGHGHSHVSPGPENLCEEAHDYPVQHEITLFWRNSWALAQALQDTSQPLQGGLGVDFFQLSDSLKGRAVSDSLLGTLLANCTGCTQVRIYFVQTAQNNSTAPDLAIVPAMDCSEVYTADSLVLLVTEQGAGFVSPTQLVPDIQRWLQTLQQIGDYNESVYAYTFSQQTIQNLVDLKEPTVRFDYAYHNYDLPDSIAPPTDTTHGVMMIDLLAHVENDSMRFYDFANPCPPICGDTSNNVILPYYMN